VHGINQPSGIKCGGFPECRDHWVNVGKDTVLDHTCPQQPQCGSRPATKRLND
jgi:hypothetical protein